VGSDYYFEAKFRAENCYGYAVSLLRRISSTEDPDEHDKLLTIAAEFVEHPEKVIDEMKRRGDWV